MSARRQDFLARYDWIRTGLMFEPRGHDMMSGSILYPPTRDDCDVGGALHRDQRLPADVRPRHHRHRDLRPGARPGPAARGGVLYLDTPAGRVEARYRRARQHVEGVRITNVGAYLAAEGVDGRLPRAGSAEARYRLRRQLLRHRRGPGELPRPGGPDAGRHPAALAPAAAPHQRGARGGPSRRIRRSAASATSSGPARPRRRRPRPATPSSTARRRSTAAPAAPAPRHAWPSWQPAASSRSARTSSTRASSAPVPRPRRGRDPGRQPPGHRPLDRGLGPDHRLQHHLHRRPRPLRPRLPSGLKPDAIPPLGHISLSGQSPQDGCQAWQCVWPSFLSS